MTVKELIEKLQEIDDKNQKIILGCEGYTTEEVNIVHNGIELFIIDDCYYEI